MDCLRWTGFFASSTTNTLCTVRVIHRVHFHLACFCTFSTVNTLFHIYSVTVNRNSIEYRIKSSQRADILTEWTIYYDRKNYCDNKNCILPYKKPADRTAHGFIQKYQRKPTFQRTCRTDQLAEIRRSLSHDVYHKHWQKNHKYYKNDIFQFTKQFISTKRPDLLWKRNFIQQILYQSKRTEESTYKSSKQSSDKDQKTNYILCHFKVPASDHCLKRSNRTGACGSRTGITVQSRNTRMFQFSSINFTSHKS